MSISNILSNINNKLRGRQRARAIGFGDLVRQVADENEPAVETVERILSESGKSLEDLGAAVEVLLRRRELRAQYDAGQAVESQLAALDLRADKVHAELTEAKKRHDDAMLPINFERDKLTRAESAARDAERVLWETAPAELKEASADNQRKLNALRKQKETLSKEIDLNRASINSRRSLLADKRHADNHETYRNQLAASEDWLKRRQKEFDELTVQEEAIVAADEALRAQALQP